MTKKKRFVTLAPRRPGTPGRGEQARGQVRRLVKIFKDLRSSSIKIVSSTIHWPFYWCLTTIELECNCKYSKESKFVIGNDI